MCSQVASFVRHATSFIRQIVREFLKIAKELREMQSKTDTARKVGVGFLIGGILEALFTTGVSAGAAATAPAAAAAPLLLLPV